jgi:radical SAM superfamily enzyme YgiQ (UPF0313 family)
MTNKEKSNKKRSQVRILLMMSFSYSDDTYTAIAPPPGLHWLRHHLSKNDYHCDVLDLDFQGERLNEFLDFTAKGNYDVIGMNMTHYNMVECIKTIWKFHKAADQSGKSVVFIGGGQEATMNYQQILKFFKLDLILTGFCENTLLKLCQNISFLLSKGEGKDTRYSIKGLSDGINGIAYIDEDGGEVYRPALPLTNEEFRQLAYTNILDLELPYFEYWEKTEKTTVDNMTFSRNVFVVESARIYTTSHCPRRCGFCSSQTFLPYSQSSKSPIIMLSAEEVHDLIVRDVTKYGAKHFVIGDDDFPVGNKPGLDRVSKVCDLIMESKRSGELPKTLTFYMQARIADFILQEKKQRFVNMDLLTKLKEAGFITFGLGVETFSDRLLRSPSVNKVGISAEDCKMVLDAMLDLGLNPLINIILCVPESTVDDLILTIRMTTRFILKGCQTNVTAIMNAFPGAPLLDRPEYKYNTMSFEVPEIGETIEILRYFTPWDPQIAEIYDNLREETAKTRLEIIKNTTINVDTLPKPVSGLTMFITVAKLLKNKKLEDELTAVTMELIKRNDLIELDEDTGLPVPEVLEC